MVKLFVLLAVMASLLTPAAHADVSNQNYYANQTLYGDPASTPIAAPPAGYQVDFLETVGRHGARSMTSTTVEKRVLALWEKARKARKLTTVGKSFKTDLTTFQTAEKSIGYGDLSSVGFAQWRGIGRRTAANYADFFDRTERDGDPIVFRTTSVHRTQQSAEAMRESLLASHRDLAVDPMTVDSRMAITSGSTVKGRAALAKALATHTTRAKAKHVLGTLYTASFVAKIKDPVAAALDIYLLYCTAPGMSGESAITFARYVPAADRPTMAQAKDAQSFYRYGPGVSGQRGSFAKADPILADFFARMDARLAGGTVAAVFRLAHGETTMPFEARIKVPGSDQQVASSRYFTYASNNWRGYVAGRTAGNVEWAMYTADGEPPLVTMRYNEQPAKFSASCRAADSSGYFYAVTELKRCLA